MFDDVGNLVQLLLRGLITFLRALHIGNRGTLGDGVASQLVKQSYVLVEDEVLVDRKTWGNQRTWHYVQRTWCLLTMVMIKTVWGTVATMESSQNENTKLKALYTQVKSQVENQNASRLLLKNPLSFVAAV